MNAGGGTVTAAAGTGPAALLRRSDAGTVRLSDRDIAELLLAGEIYGAPYDLLAAFWRYGQTGHAGSWPAGGTPGYAATGRLGPGPAWCWLTRPGLACRRRRLRTHPAPSHQTAQPFILGASPYAAHSQPRDHDHRLKGLVRGREAGGAAAQCHT